jgi:hypothetical protein
MSEKTMEVLPANYVPEEKFIKELEAAKLTEEVFQNVIAHRALAEKPITSKEEYQKIKDIKNKEVVKVRTRTVEVCEAGRAESNRVSKEWLNVQKKYVGIVKETEEVLNARLEEWEAIDLAKQKEEEAEKKLPLRTNILTNSGITLEPETYKYLTDDEFLTLFNAENEKVAQAKRDAEAAKERLANAEKEKIRIQNETLAKARTDIRVRTVGALGFKPSADGTKYAFIMADTHIIIQHIDLVEMEDEAFNKFVDDAEKRVHDAHEKEADFKAKVFAEEQKQKSRSNSLQALGFLYSGMNKEFIFQDITTGKVIKVSSEEIFALSDEDFDKMFVELRTGVDAIKVGAQKIIIKADEDARKAKEKAENDAKAAQEALKPDKEKLLAFVQALSPVYPEVTSDKAKKIVAYAEQLIAHSKTKLIEQINLI